MALPQRVKRKKISVPRKARAETASTRRPWGERVAPRKRMGLAGRKGFTGRGSFPQPNMASPFIKMETPMVMMMRMSGEAVRAGRMVSLSVRIPARVAPTRAATATTGKGQPRPESQAVNMAPSMTNSPWAKLITPVAL